MSKLNSDGIDESQWLPRNTPPINPFRMKHGKLRWEGQSIKDYTWLPDILFWDLEKINQGHHFTAQSFFKILVHAKRTLGICDLRGSLFDKHPDGLSSETDLFIEICKALPKPELNAIVWLVWDDYNHGNTDLAIKLMGTIMHGLENAQKVIDTCRYKK